MATNDKSSAPDERLAPQIQGVIRSAAELAARAVERGEITESEVRSAVPKKSKYALDDRKSIVRMLSAEGKSEREIAKEVNVSRDTVRADLGKSKPRVVRSHTTAGTKVDQSPSAPPEDTVRPLMVPDGAGGMREATEAEQAANQDSINRAAAYGVHTSCAVNAVHHNPLVVAWRASDDDDRTIFVRLFQGDIARYQQEEIGYEKEDQDQD